MEKIQKIETQTSQKHNTTAQTDPNEATQKVNENAIQTDELAMSANVGTATHIVGNGLISQGSIDIYKHPENFFMGGGEIAIGCIIKSEPVRAFITDSALSLQNPENRWRQMNKHSDLDSPRADECETPH